MMEKAVRTGKRIGLLATLATTVPSSERLLDYRGGGGGNADRAEKRFYAARPLKSIPKEILPGTTRYWWRQLTGFRRRWICIVMAQLSMSALARRF